MTEETIKEYYKLMDMFSVSILASKWLNENKDIKNEQLITLNEYLYYEFLKFGINNVGLLDN